MGNGFKLGIRFPENVAKCARNRNGTPLQPIHIHCDKGYPFVAGE
jgi:hypothetical protein